MAALGVHVFYMYCLARTANGQFGFDLSNSVIAAIFAFVMLVPLVWAVTLPELPEIYTTHVRPRRWWRQGRCAACGYALSGLPTHTCPECGKPIAPPGTYQVGGRTVRLFIAINVMAWMLGCMAGEAWLQLDEANFRREVQEQVALGHDDHQREAAWPNEGALMWTRQEGFSKSAVLAGP